MRLEEQVPLLQQKLLLYSLLQILYCLDLRDGIFLPRGMKSIQVE